MREHHTYLVVSFFAGDLRHGICRGAYSSPSFAQREREYLERRLGVHAVVKVYDADQIPKTITVRV